MAGENSHPLISRKSRLERVDVKLKLRSDEGRYWRTGMGGFHFVYKSG